jgi:hypothetical protein
MSIVLLSAVLLISYGVILLGVLALEMTGMDSKASWFQALSAYTGTGFTTRVSERIMGHPIRRKIVTYLIVLGNFGLVSVLSTMVVSSTSRDFGLGLHALNLAVLALGFYLFYRLTVRLGPLKRSLNKITRLLGRKLGLDRIHYEELLLQDDNNGVASLLVGANDPMTGKTIKDVLLSRRGLRLLSIQRDEEIIPFPKPDATLISGDRLLFYGNLRNLRNVADDSTVSSDLSVAPGA